MDPTDTTTQATVCTDCGNIQANLQTVRGGLVCDNCIEGYTYVHCCEEHVHNDNVCYTEDEGGVYICDDCVNGPERKICADCGELHRRRNMVRHEGDECYYCSDCIEVHCEDEDEDEDDEQPTDTTGRINNTAAAQAHLPILEATSVPTQLQEHLREFYGRHVLDNVYSYKAIQATGTIQLPNTAAAMVYKNLRDKLREKYAYAQQEVIRCCKYYDTTSVHSEGAIVHYKAIDNVGKTQHRKEHINKVADYYKTRYNIAVDYDVRAMQTNDYSVELSNSIEAKLLQGQANEDYRRSCQVPDNKHYYSKGYYDFYNNGALAVVTIRKAGKILGRQVVRFALADDGTEYAILDRLYKTGELANYEAKKAVYEQVFARLLSMYNVAVCTTSAHDDDVASLVRDYVQLHTLQHIIPTSSIRTPKRKAGKIYCAYYHDSGTKTYKSKDGYIYDCLEKNSFYILTKIA